MWADSLLAAEQRHVLGIALWSAASLLAGGGLVALVARRDDESVGLVRHFALQLVVLGVVVALLAAFRWGAMTTRDLASATRLERSLWFATGLETGIAALGLTLAAAAWFGGRRLAGVGAGLAITVHALALLVLDLRFLTAVSR